MIVCRCVCSEHGNCSPVNGSCLCDEGWVGPSCNVSTDDYEHSNGTTHLENTTTIEQTVASWNSTTTSESSTREPVTESTTDDVTIISSTESCQPPNHFAQQVVAVAMVTIVGCSTVVAHLLIWWICHKQRQKNYFDKRTHPKLKRRKLRKKPPFMRVPLQSSSDCSI